jgi:hypothetical protein
LEDRKSKKDRMGIHIYIFNEQSAIQSPEKELNMLWTIFVILCALWLLTLLGGYTLGGLIHLLLVGAIVVLLVRIYQGRKIKF